MTAPRKKAKAKRSVCRTWRIGYDDKNGKRCAVFGDNRKKSLFDEIVLGDWLHVEMMNDRPECYWMRVGTGENERVFTIYVRNGVRVVRQDEGPGHE